MPLAGRAPGTGRRRRRHAATPCAAGRLPRRRRRQLAPPRSPLRAGGAQPAAAAAAAAVAAAAAAATPAPTATPLPTRDADPGSLRRDLDRGRARPRWRWPARSVACRSRSATGRASGMELMSVRVKVKNRDATPFALYRGSFRLALSDRTRVEPLAGGDVAAAVLGEHRARAASWKARSRSRCPPAPASTAWSGRLSATSRTRSASDRRSRLPALSPAPRAVEAGEVHQSGATVSNRTARAFPATTDRTARL